LGIAAPNNCSSSPTTFLENALALAGLKFWLIPKVGYI
jgi:hypothetical protein